MINLINVNSFNNLPPGQSIIYVSQQMGVPCETIFVSAIIKDLKKSLPAFDRPEIYNLARAACQTQNPDIVWQIFKVETNFRVYVINLGGEKVLTGQAAKTYLQNGIKKSDNIDIGPLQINWRANGSHYPYNPEKYFSGTFVVQFLSNHLLKDLVMSCKTEWINCYHSHNKVRGNDYRAKIERSGAVLKQILYDFTKF